jgi:hypothetical protein
MLSPRSYGAAYDLLKERAPKTKGASARFNYHMVIKWVFNHFMVFIIN